MLTTNRGIASWGNGGEHLSEDAMLDRLLDRSYRLRSHHARADTLRTAVRQRP